MDNDIDSWYLIAALGVCLLVGASLNFIAFFTYLRKRRRKPTHIFTLCLAIVDFFNCLILSLVVLRRYGVSEMFEDAVCTLQLYLTNCGVLVSGGLVISIAFERCNKVSSPFRVVAREIYWIAVLLIAVTGLVLSFAIPVYRAVGYNRTWIPMALLNKTERLDYRIEDILIHPDILIPVVFYGFEVLLFFVGYLLIFGQYTKLTRAIIGKKQFGRIRKSYKDDRDSGTALIHKRNMCGGTDGVASSVEASSTCSTVQGNGSKDDVSDFKLDDRAVFTIYSSDYYRNLSHIISKPPEKVTYQQRPKVHKGGPAGPRTSSSSVVTRSRSRSPWRTLLMICFALTTFALYFPRLIIAMLNFITPSVKEGSSPEMRFILDVLELSYVFAFSLNPVLYTFCNFGFRVDFVRAFGCRDICGRAFEMRSSLPSTARNSAVDIPGKTKTRPKARLDATPQLPYITELENRLLNTNGSER